MSTVPASANTPLKTSPNNSAVLLKISEVLKPEPPPAPFVSTAKKTEAKRVDKKIKAKIAAEKKRLEALRLQRLRAAEAARKARAAQLAAQRTKTAQAAPAPVTPPVTTPVVGGKCTDWIAAAGIPLTYAVDTLITKESGCNPAAINPTSGACGIPQALPCSKMPCTLQDPVCQLRWMNTYVAQRYGSWENALAFHLRNNWY